ncbi:MAG: hypothetical protein WA003_06490 [Desulfuromonadaceae bacterium]
MDSGCTLRQDVAAVGGGIWFYRYRLKKRWPDDGRRNISRVRIARLFRVERIGDKTQMFCYKKAAGPD